MGLNYRNLDEVTRGFMLEEIDLDTPAGRLYFSSYLSDRGREDWPTPLRAAAENGTDDAFGMQLQQMERINQTAQRGGSLKAATQQNVPVTAHDAVRG